MLRLRDFLSSPRQSLAGRAMGLISRRCLSSAAMNRRAPPTSSGPVLRENEVEQKLLWQFQNGTFEPPVNPKELTMEGVGLNRSAVMQIVEAMFTTRIAHNITRREAATGGRVHYTIGPGGHESVAALAMNARVTDPALLHYRDTAFQLMRSRMHGYSFEETIEQLMRSYVVSKYDKATGGRHKALGDPDLNIIPSTSTISSHFPRAVGLASSIPLNKRLKTTGVDPVYPDDAIVIASGGDAGINHATYRSAVNFLTFSHLGRQLPVPALMVVVDNGIGISVPTPHDWVEKSLTATNLPYFTADGCNIFDVHQASTQAVASARKGAPTFLHIKCSRLFNHAGSDAGNYMSPQQVADTLARDPLPHTIGLLTSQGVATQSELEEMYMSIHEQTEAMLERVIEEPKLTSLAEIEAAIVPATSQPSTPTSTSSTSSTSHATSKSSSSNGANNAAAASSGGKKSYRVPTRPLILKQQINQVLKETLNELPGAVLIGQDIGEKGGNYGVTDGLKKSYGALRVRDAFLDETSILGMGLGLSLNGLLPIVEICYLAYIHNAIDQLRGEAATLSFFSNGAYSNGMMIRVSGGGLTEFGGHFHNENSIASLLDIPGVIVLYSSSGKDYTQLFRTCVQKANDEGRVVVVIEPIKSYALRDFGMAFPSSPSSSSSPAASSEEAGKKTKADKPQKLEWVSTYPARDMTLGLDYIGRYEYDVASHNYVHSALDSESSIVTQTNDETQKNGSGASGEGAGDVGSDGVLMGGEGSLAIVTYGNGVVLSLEAQQLLAEKHGVDNVTVLDRPILRGGMSPDRFNDLLRPFDHVLFADESRLEGCLSAELITSLTLSSASASASASAVPKIGLVAAANSFLPLGEASKVDGLYLSSQRIVDEALAMLGR